MVKREYLIKHLKKYDNSERNLSITRTRRFTFRASELVKHYGLKSKVKFGTYGKDEGGYNWDTDTINLNKYYPKVSEFIITVLHEIHHV